MSEDEAYFLDVSAVALSHAMTPYSRPALDYVQRGIAGEIEVVMPYEVLYGAQHQLEMRYNLSNPEASHRMLNLYAADSLRWVSMDSDTANAGLHRSKNANIEAWDGFFAEMALQADTSAIVSLDNDFERIEGPRHENPLTPEQAKKLHQYIERLSGENRDDVDNTDPSDTQTDGGGIKSYDPTSEF